MLQQQYLPLAVAALALAYFGGPWIYNLFLHPLKSYPGPILHRVSRLPYCYHLLRGTLAFHVLDLHKKYGPVVRLAPDELAFADPAAWKDIMGHHGNRPEFAKWEKFYKPVNLDLGASSIIFSSREEHSSLRRQLAHGFSDRSMREQQPMIGRHVDLLLQRLREAGGGGTAPLNMADWYNFTTFDIIGDLAFGESFGCLDNSDYHPWVKAIFQMGFAGSFFQAASHYPVLQRFIVSLIPKSAAKMREDHIEFTKAKLRRRMELGQDRPDLIEGLLRKKDELGLDMDKLEANSSLLIIGGSETTATLLSGVTYLLLMNPGALENLTQEVRSAFSSEDEIDFSSASRLPYMLACLEEALRMYPPVPLGLPRVTPPGGATVAGRMLPEKTVVAVYQWALYHNEAYFKDPSGFHPERFLGDHRFERDHRDALQPFHLGPRNCIGKNLAYAEMRLILARIIYNFDMRISEESRGWMNQKIWNFWQRGRLLVYLTPARRHI